MSEFKPTADQLKASDLIGSRALHIALGGGSRSGKTFWLNRAMIIRALMAPGSRQAIFRFRANALNASVVEDTFPKVMELCFPGLFNRDNFKKSPNFYYEFGNGSQIWFAGLDDKDRVEKILGQEFVTLYFNECSQIPFASVTLAMTRLAQKVEVPATADRPVRDLALKVYYDFNPPSKRHWTYQQFVEHKNPSNSQPLGDEFNWAFMFMNPAGNKQNLSSEYLKILDALPERARNRFLLGRFADDSEGSLWSEELLEQQRFLPSATNELPKMARIIIAVDPSGCSGDEDFRSDEVGIVVCGLGVDGKGYVLEDLSGRFGPRDWARIVNSAYTRHVADKIVAEQNYGGEMVRFTLQAENANLPVGLVHASRGKIVRAEPISQLYEKGLIYHVGYFPEIEEQMCGFTIQGYQGIRSPDRCDAVVWGFSELFPGIAKKSDDSLWVPPKVITRKRSAAGYVR